MTPLCDQHLAEQAKLVLQYLKEKSLCTAESLTGGMIGSILTSVPGASRVYRGGVICYTNEVKNAVLGVPSETLETYGAVSEQTARAMAEGARRVLDAQVAVAVTGLAGPDGDEFGNPVGTVFIGYCDDRKTLVKHCLFSGSREEVRRQTAAAALELILQNA